MRSNEKMNKIDVYILRNEVFDYFDEFLKQKNLSFIEEKLVEIIKSDVEKIFNDKLKGVSGE